MKWKGEVGKIAKRTDTILKIYISGPMTGYKDFNYPAFDAMAEKIKQLGYEPINPTVLGVGVESLDISEKDKYQKYMRVDIKGLMDADAIILLEGWENSEGATLEYGLALKVGIIEVILEDLNFEK